LNKTLHQPPAIQQGNHSIDGVFTQSGSFSEVGPSGCVVCSTPANGHRRPDCSGPKSANRVISCCKNAQAFSAITSKVMLQVAFRRNMAANQTAIITRRKVAGMEVASLLGLLFWLLNRASNSFCRSAARPLFSAASNAFMVGP
jgi:hypothetical protein